MGMSRLEKKHGSWKWKSWTRANWVHDSADKGMRYGEGRKQKVGSLMSEENTLKHCEVRVGDGE